MSYDASYKHLFSHPEMVADLLRGYVREPWVEELDFTTLEKMNAGYVSDDLRQREDDVVWRVRLGPHWIYLYLLLEFQSSVEPFMAVRLLSYIGLLYQDLIKQGVVTDRLPPVFPIVIYNGLRRWTAATSLAELVEPMPPVLRAYQPNLHYWLLDEGRLPDSALISENRVTALLMLERSDIPADIIHALERLILWLDADEQRSLRRAFAVWVNRVLLKTKFPAQDFPQLNELSEVRDMLEERVHEWTEQWKRNGLEEGLRQGMEKGRLEGETAILLRLLQRKFGVLPEVALERIHGADADTLLLWSERILTAARWEEVFDYPTKIQ